MIYFSMGGWCGKFSNYMGHCCLTKSNNMDSWYFVGLKGKKEYRLPKKRSFIKSSQKKRRAKQTPGESAFFCLYAIVKTRMFPANIGKKRYPNKLPNSGFCSDHYYTWETVFFY